MLSIIAAISENRVIGNENKLLWHIPEDMQRFQKLTTGHPVIMGRKTHESIGRALPNRTNIIVTRDKNYQTPGCIIVHSVDEAIKQSANSNQQSANPETFIIGGAQIYAQTINLADTLYLTVVHKNFTGDAVFPDYSRFAKVVSKEDKEASGLHYTFLKLTPAL